MERLVAAVDSGGQGLPADAVRSCNGDVESGSMAFAIGPTLTIGAVEAMEKTRIGSVEGDISGQACVG